MRVRDPVHGDILIDPAAKDVLATKAMQRLRGLKQLGLTHLVYPGCVHTRFDHSLGTYHMAKRLYHSSVDESCREELAAVSCAALLHDAAHMPFGHTLEEEFGLFGRHDRAERMTMVLNDTEVKSALLGHGLYDFVVNILLDTLPESRRYLTDIVKSTIDADVLDYLRRDAYFAGLVHNYDDRVLESFTVVDGRLVYRLVHKGLPRPDARSELVHLLRLRYYLTERLYYHHAKIAASVMLAKVVQKVGFSEAHLAQLTDELLLEDCRRHAVESSDHDLLSLFEALKWRRLYKRAFVHAADQSLLARFNNVRQFESLIAQKTGLNPIEVGVYCGPRGVLKEANITILTRRGCEPLSQGENGDIGELAEQYRRLPRFYVFAPADKVAPVRLAVEEMLNCRSEYRKDLTSL
ncbi:MAG: HD domain-containing protein [Firmicutes bacterium]|nr:HD domain-containing protein [Dethiobacter sp.]MBS3889114.1 HD domain-containing protein [Bacillota bacterium]